MLAAPAAPMYPCEFGIHAYFPRSPWKSEYYRLVEENYEQLERSWSKHYQPKYGYWRPHIIDVIHEYLDCGNPHLGSARVKCNDCRHEFIVPFTCKRRHFCPSCHQKRVIEFGEYLSEDVLVNDPHRQWLTMGIQYSQEAVSLPHARPQASVKAKQVCMDNPV